MHFSVGSQPFILTSPGSHPLVPSTRWLIQRIFTYLFLGHNSASYLSNMLTQSQEQSSM